MNLNKRVILGISVDDVTMAEAIEHAEKMLSGSRPRMISTLNPEIILKALRDEEYAAVLSASDMALPDGIGLVWASKCVGKPLRERVAGSDFMLQLCDRAATQGKSVFLLGGRNGAARKTADALRKKFPLLRIIGYSEDIERWQNIPELSKADIIFIALGAPRQEEWIRQAMPQLPHARILLAVGGTFDMVSGAAPRAPASLRNAGLEWLWRFMLEPHKRFMRVCNAVIIFPLAIFFHIFFPLKNIGKSDKLDGEEWQRK